MYFFLFFIIVLLLIDFLVQKSIKSTLNKFYKKNIDMINKLNPLTKLEYIQAKNSYFMRMLILALFWLVINLFFHIYTKLKNVDNISLEIIDNYSYTIFIILGYFVYFFINLYSKTNIYMRTVDIILSTFFTILVMFIS